MSCYYFWPISLEYFLDTACFFWTKTVFFWLRYPFSNKVLKFGSLESLSFHHALVLILHSGLSRSNHRQNHMRSSDDIQPIGTTSALSGVFRGYQRTGKVCRGRFSRGLKETLLSSTDRKAMTSAAVRTVREAEAEPLPSALVNVLLFEPTSDLDYLSQTEATLCGSDRSDAHIDRIKSRILWRDQPVTSLNNGIQRLSDLIMCFMPSRLWKVHWLQISMSRSQRLKSWKLGTPVS